MRCKNCLCDGVVWCLQREREQAWLKVKPEDKLNLLAWARAIKNGDCVADLGFMDWGEATGNCVFEIPDRIWGEV